MKDSFNEHYLFAALPHFYIYSYSYFYFFYSYSKSLIAQVIASVGLDKKLYTYDSGSRRSTSCVAYDAPFSSLAFRDDGWVLAAGTSSGHIVFYDVRAKPEPFSVLRAYNSSEVNLFLAKSLNCLEISFLSFLSYIKFSLLNYRLLQVYVGKERNPLL